jgi:hypothetical protein
MPSKAIRRAFALALLLLGACRPTSSPAPAAHEIAAVPVAAPHPAPASSSRATAAPDAFEVLPVVDEAVLLDGFDAPPDEVKVMTERVSCGPEVKCTSRYAAVHRRASEPLERSRERLHAALRSVPVPAGTRWGIARVMDSGTDGVPEQLGWRSHLLREPAVLQTRDIVQVRAHELNGYYFVQLRLEEQAADRFGRYTAEHKQTRIAIALDGIVESVPVVMEEIRDTTLQLHVGPSNDEASAQRVSARLREAAGLK